MSECKLQVLDVNCPHRLLLDQIMDKWSVLILTALDGGPMRFNAIKRRLGGVTQKALTQSLRRLERNGIVSRRVVPVSPVAVEYRMTALGCTLQPRFKALFAWTVDCLPQVEQAREDFDQRASGRAATSPLPSDPISGELQFRGEAAG